MRSWKSNYIPFFYMDEITYPCSNPDAGLDDLCQQKRLSETSKFNTLRPRQNGRHFADDIFKRISLYENIWIPIKISLKFVPRGSINNIPALVQIMAWRRPGDKPLSEAMMVNLPTHICVSRPQWVRYYWPCSESAWQVISLYQLLVTWSELWWDFTLMAACHATSGLHEARGHPIQCIQNNRSHNS